MLGGGRGLEPGHLLVVGRCQRLHGGHGLLQESHIVEAQTDLLLQIGLVLDPAGQVLLLNELLLMLLGSTVPQAGQSVTIPTQLLLGTTLATLVAAHHVGVIGGIHRTNTSWCGCRGGDLLGWLWLLLFRLGLIQPRPKEAWAFGLRLIGSSLTGLLHNEYHIVIGFLVLAAFALQSSCEFLVAVVLHCSAFN